MADNRYYEEELTYLSNAGEEYADAHPERARFLKIKDPRHRDPHVERLVEAFAFLTGNVRRKLDDDFPELTHAFLDLVWPYHLRPIPSMALLEFKPRPGMLRESQTIDRHFLVDSRRTSQEVACRFRTAYAVEMHPFHLAEAGLVADEAGQRRLRLRFELEEGVEAPKLKIDRLRLHLAGEPSIAFALYRLLHPHGRQVDSVLLRWGKEGKRLLGDDVFRPVGFAPEEEVLPYPSTSFPGYRLLSEYFCFPEKFLFLDLVGIGAFSLGAKENQFEIEVRFRGKVPESLHPTAASFRLYVTPIVNVFPKDGQPITVDRLKVRHRVLGDFTHPDAYEVFSVDAVESLRTQDGARFPRHSLYSFSHDAAELGEERGVYYHVTHDRPASGGWRTFLSLISSQRGKLPSEEVLSLSLTCSNGRLAPEVGIEEIKLPGGERKDFATFHNLTRPTDPIYPRLGEGTLWRFVSQMALNLLSLSDPAALRALLSLYDADERPANQRRIASIQGARLSPREILDRGAPIRGTELTLRIDDSRFDQPGDLLIFGEVLAEFLSLYSNVNSFTELNLEPMNAKEALRWPASQGKQPLL